MQKPGASPQEKSEQTENAEGARYKVPIANCHGSLPKGHIPRLQRCEQLLRVFPAAMPQAFAFRALGA